LKQGEKISNLKNASRNIIHIYLFDYLQKDFEKEFAKTFAKTKQVVQVWSKMLKKAIHAYLLEV
jgi:ribosomal protein S17E